MTLKTLSQKQRRAWKDRLDKITSGIVEKRAGGKCQKCGGKGIEQHHCHCKATNAVHFCLDGIKWVCRSCHDWLGDHPTANRDWFCDTFGYDVWDKLTALSWNTGLSLQSCEDDLRKEVE